MEKIDLWYHGGPRVDDWDALRWERPRHMDQNEEGPGMYWTESKAEAEGYMNGGVLYSAKLLPKFSMTSSWESPRLKALFELFERVDQEDRVIFYGDRGFDGPLPFGALRTCLQPYVELASMAEAFTALYHDLFRNKSEQFVAAMRSMSYDGAVVRKSTGVHHLVLWNPKAVEIQELP